MRARFSKASFFSVSKRELFEFHEREDAFSLLTPALANVDVESTASTLAPSDDVVRFAVRFGPLRFRFENVHTIYEPFDLFVDEQRKGLFAEWRHEHRFVEAGWENDPASMLNDEIVYSHPLLPLFDPFVKHRLRKLFDYRHRITTREVHGARAMQEATGGPRIVVTGATGLIGGRLVEILREKGVHVIAFVRDVERTRRLLGDEVTCVRWDFHRPKEGDWKRHLAEADGVAHLAGTPLFERRWSTAFKREMEESRTLGTRQLVDGIIESGRRPRVFVSASALGYYGIAADRVVDEDSAPADDLLARICMNWEREARRLDEHGVRTVQMRIGIVLSTESGALKEVLPLFRLGVGATMGDPHPYINWIHVEDVARMFAMALANGEVTGPIIAAAPNPVTNREFAKAIARVLGRPALLRLPVPVLKLVIGEAGEYASGGPRASVNRVQDAGYRFFFSDLDRALDNLLHAV
jgi:uncharacterized protein (TIGR01777 family)